MRTPFSVRCTTCNHPSRDHHRDSCDGLYLHPLRFTASNCNCRNPLGLRKRSRRRSAWRDVTVSASTVQVLGANSLIASVVLGAMWYFEAF